MSDYIVKHGVPIVDEHTLFDDEGEPLVTLTEPILRKIAQRNNDRVRLTGDEVPITIGHTKGEPGDYVPEEHQPEIVGYARDFKVAPFFKTGKKCVTATFKLMKRYASKIAKYPRRSIEIWLGDWKVDPISLLGATTPSRDLGLLRLAADGRKVYRRVLPTQRDENVNPQEIVQAVLKALEQTDVFQYCRKKMEEESASQDGMDDQGGLPPEAGEDEEMYGDEQGGPPPEEGEEAPGGPSDQDDLSEDQEEGKAPVKMSGAACASGTNSFAPNGGMGKKKPPRRVEYSRASQAGDRIRLSRLEAAVQASQKREQALRLKLARAERERDLAELAGEGIEFDLGEELEDGLTLSDAAWAKQLGKIRKRYSRSLTASTDWNAHARTQAASGITSASQAREVAQYALDKGVSYEQARQELGLD